MDLKVENGLGDQPEHNKSLATGQGTEFNSCFEYLVFGQYDTQKLKENTFLLQASHVLTSCDR